jgi:Zn-dependent protease with chaperone function
MSDAKQFPSGGNHSDAFESGISSPKPSGNLLQSGLLALKQKEYRRAIELLEAVCQIPIRRSDRSAGELRSNRLKAEMGLVKAYARTQQPQKAIDLCRTLCGSPNPQVQGWANQTLSDLQYRYGIAAPSVAAPSVTAPSNVPLAEEPTVADWTDETGFVPLDADIPDSGFSPFAAAAPETVSPQQANFRRASVSETSSDTPAVQAAISPSPEPSDGTASARSAPLPPREAATDHSSRKTASQRLQKGASLGTVDRSGFWALQAGTIALLIGWLCALIHFGRDRLNEFLLSVRFDFFNLSVWTVYFDPFWGVVIGLTVLFFASPWLLDLVLKSCYGMKDWRRAELESFSPEALRLLRQLTQSYSLPFPTLKRLPIAVPLCFSYGYLPRNARIVVSQGLLERLEPDEIAALYAAEWAHITQREVGILSLVAIAAQLPYQVYWSVASWGNRQSLGILQSLAIGVSSLGYGIYWLLRIPALLLSRIRLYFSDRTAAELTGNPNGLSRALLKLTIGMAETLVQHGSTPPLVESFDLLMPVGYRQSLTLGSLHQLPEPDLLEWDCRQPYCAWLNALNGHPLLGDRLNRLADYARHWRLEPQIFWKPEKPGSAANPRLAWLCFAPYLGILAGWLVAGILWAIGFLAKQMRWLEIDWMWADWSVVTGLGLLGFSLGTFLRINAFFPDIKRSALKGEVPLRDWLSDPVALPIDPHPVRLQGQLYGRRGILNRLHQDLFLQIDSPPAETASHRGMIRLHYTSQIGWLGDLLFQVVRPEIWLAPPPKTVTVVGWFRRGVVPWIDVETIQSPRGTIARSDHPVWSAILGTIAALAGAYIILTGGS